MSIIRDKEFGDIEVRRHVNARHIRLKVAPNGSLQATLPPYAPLFMLKRLVRDSEAELRKILSQHSSEHVYSADMQIGKSHKIIVEPVDDLESRIYYKKPNIVVELAVEHTLSTPKVAEAVRKNVIRALRAEAKAYLPRQLKHLASIHGYSYSKVRFSHARGRWGSCSSSGTISLNIALMKLPFALIDYVLIHELCHTKTMSHSPVFWQSVEASDPDFKIHRKELKNYNPYV